MLRPVSAAEVKQWLEKNEAVLVDVREPGEWAQGHIAGATLVPLSTVCGDALPPHAGKKLVMQCKSGGRSRTACNLVLQEFPGMEVYNLEGGITAWAAAGFPVAV